MAPTSPEQAFVSAIASAPDDSTPRLLLADYWEERGDPRGVVIKTEQQLCDCPVTDRSRRRALMRERSRCLQAARDKWNAILRALKIDEHQVEFDRGLPVAVRLSTADANVRDALEGLFLVAPIHDVRVEHATDDSVKDVGDLAGTQYVTSLSLPAPPQASTLTGSTVASLCRMNTFRNLRRLNLTNQGLTPLTGVCLARSAVLTQLRCLLVGGNYLYDGIEDYLCSANAVNLEVLDISDNRVTDRALTALSRVRQLTNLRVLKIGGNDVSVRGVRGLSTSTLPRLTELALDRNGLHSNSARAILDGSTFPQLKALDLRTNEIGYAGGEALLYQTRLQYLETVYLQGNHPLGQFPHLTAALLRRYGTES